MSKIQLILPRRTPPQKRIQDSLARFKVAAWGRQSGKTTNGGWTLVKKPFNGRRSGVYWHILQTHTAAEVAFNRYIKQFPRDSWSYLWAKRPNESEKTAFLSGYREVHFKSGENYQDLRVETLDGAIIDECRQQAPELWPQIIRPMLSRRKGWCDFYSTPNGFDWFFDLFELAKQDLEWASFHAPSTEAWWWTPEEIESARRTMSEAEFAQEILAEFRELYAGKVYQSFGAHNMRDSCPWADGKRYAPFHSIVLGLDFNLSPMSWTLGQTAADRWWWFDEIYLQRSHTLEAAQALRDKILLFKDEGYRAEPNLILCGDATGKATQRSSNQSDYDIVKQVLRDAKITFRDDTPEANPSVKDRVNAVNAKCRSATGDIEMYFHTYGVPMLKRDLERVVWKTGADFVLDAGKDRMLTHSSDSIGYPIHRLTPIRGVRDIGRTRIIQRVL